MRLIILYTILFAGGFISLGTMMFGDTKPELMILGTWKEVSWEYETINKNSNHSDISNLQKMEQLSTLLGENLLLHENERWVFNPNGQLIIQQYDGVIIKEMRWYLKSRGNVLVFKDQGEIIESYTLYELTENKLILNINLDIQARGIAKLTFEKEK